MYRITIIGRDLKEFQENLQAYAEVHLGKVKVVKVSKTKVTEQLLTENEDEMEEVESPYTASPSLTAVEEVEEIQETETATVAHTGDLDSEGFPWDKRIHSSSKQVVADGSWRKRRNLDDTIYNAVKAELASKGYGKVAPKVETPVVTPTLAPQPVIAPTPTVTQASVVQAAPAPVTPPLPQMMTGGHTVQTFSDNFPMVLAGLINEKKLTQDWINQLAAHYGVTEIWTLNAEQKAQVFDLFVQNGLVTRVG